ncbi:MAG: CpsB/CapC family capsule biosynthesis tyrosine phosphatase [Thermodesulfobacteriota bacterium]
MIDIHCHILPGIDDGPREWEESLAMCEMAAKDGIRTIVATPHINNGQYSNSKEKIIEKIEELRERINNRFDLEILIGADTHVSFDLVDRLQSKEIPTINNKNYILLELPHELLPPNLENLIFNMKVMGITPIITHVERTLWIKRKFEELKKLIQKGALLQITAMSITGEFGRSAQQWSEKLLKENLVHIIASDGHSINGRPPILSRALNAASSIAGSDDAYAMVHDTPLRIIRGEELRSKNV